MREGSEEVKKDKGENRKVVSVSMDEKEYEYFKKSKEYMSEEFLEEEISDSEFLRYIIIGFYHELNEIERLN